MAAKFFTPGLCRIASNAGVDLGPRRAMSGAAFPATRRLIAASDCVRAYPQLIAFYVDTPLTAPGMGGFGSSGRRSSQRRFFAVGIAMSPRSVRDRDRFRMRKSRSNRLLRPRNGGGGAMFALKECS